jgi:hypothetical protein
MLADLAAARERAAALAQQRRKAERRLEAAAPRSAARPGLAATTIGGVVTPAQRLLIIVPEVEAFAPDKNTGFEQPRQEAQSAAALPASAPILVGASPWALLVGSSTSRLHHLTLSSFQQS